MNPPRTSARGRGFGLRLLFRLVGWSFSAAIALVVLAYLALPAVLRYGLPHVLTRYGVESSVDGASVDLGNEKVTLVGFQVGRAGGPAIRWGEVTARVDMAELLKGNIRIIEFQVKDARLDLARIRASDWRPPERPAAIPELKKLNIDVGSVLLEDLEFVGLSENIGQKVALRSVSVGSLSHLEAGERVAFQLQAAIGGGELNLAGQAQLVDDLPVFEGRYELEGLELRGFGRLLGLETPGSVGGRVRGLGTFALELVGKDGVIRADFSGEAAVSELAFESGQARVTRAAAEWSGDARVRLPMSGEAARFAVDGKLAASAVEAAWRTSGAPVGILARGLEWSGQLSRESELTMRGRISGNRLRIDSSRDAEIRFGLDLSRLAALSSLRAGSDGYVVEVEKLTADKATLAGTREIGRLSAEAFKLSLQGLRVDDRGVILGRLAAESAEAALIGGAADAFSHRAKFIGLEADGVESLRDKGAAVERIEAVRASLDLGRLSLELSEARALGVGAGASVEADALYAASLRQTLSDAETWASAIQLSGAGLSMEGRLVADEARVERLSQSVAGRPLWESSGLHAEQLSIGAAELAAGGLSAGHFAYGGGGGELIELDDSRGSDLLLEYGSRIDAATLKAATLRYRSGQISMFEIQRAEIDAPGITFAGGLSARQLDAGSARYVDAGANVSVLETLELGALSGGADGAVLVDALHADRFAHDRAAGVDYDGAGLQLGRVEYAPSGKVSAISGRADSLVVLLDDGARLVFEDMAIAQPARTAAGDIYAGGGRARQLSYRMPGDRAVLLTDVRLGAVDGDGAGAHRIASISAAGAEASDPAVAGGLRTGALRLAAIRVSAEGRVSAGEATASAVTVGGVDGEPAAAFSAHRLDLNGFGLESGARLRIDRVLLDAAELTMGLDEQGELVLPRLPILAAGDESAGSLAVVRMETRGSARLNFFDRSTSPDFEVSVSALQARLEDFHILDSKRRATFSVDGSLGEYSSITSSGDFSLQADGLDLALSGKVAAFDLSRLNMYAEKHAKRAVRSGRGDAVFDIAVDGSKLSGTIRFVFSNVVFERANASGAEAQNPSELTLQHSFAMLRDKDGIVRLTVPLSGSLDDPQFNFSDGLVQALIKTVRGTVMLTFKPLGLLVSAAGLVGGTEALEFRPVAFDPGEQRLSGEGLAHLDALARELEAHPGVAIRVCGRAVSADRIRFEQRRSESPADAPESAPAGVDRLLSGLAEARSEAVRRYLEDQKQLGPSRLLRCGAKVETTPGRLPRVDLPVRIDAQVRPSAEPAATR